MYNINKKIKVDREFIFTSDDGKSRLIDLV